MNKTTGESIDGRGDTLSSSSSSPSPSPSAPAQKKQQADGERRTAKFGRKGDPRMHRAVEARLADPSMKLLDALLKGGFVFPDLDDGSDVAGGGDDEKKTHDTDGVPLIQRKNQLSRRLRLTREQSQGGRGSSKTTQKRMDRGRDASSPQSPPAAAPAQKKQQADGERNVSKLGRRGDPRMHRAVEARLADPSMKPLDALLEGGFVFPDLVGADDDADNASGKVDDETEIHDTDGVPLAQRKNQLSRRLRLTRERSQVGRGSSKATQKRLKGKKRKRSDDADVKAAEKRSEMQVSDREWNAMFASLCLHRKKHGDYHPSAKSHASLAHWVTEQRHLARNSTLSKPKRLALSRIGFFHAEEEFKWRRKFDELIRFKEQHGHTNVVCNHSGSKAAELQNFAELQRFEYWRKKAGQPSSLTTEREAKLSELGFVWDAQEVDWNVQASDLLDAQALPQKQTEGQKSDKNEEGQKEERKDCSKKIKSSRWDIMFQRLVKYQKDHGHCCVGAKAGNAKEENQLARWCHNQRRFYRLAEEGRKTSLTDERIRALENIGFEWTTKNVTKAATKSPTGKKGGRRLKPASNAEDFWTQQYRKLCDYRAKHGHDNVPKDYDDQSLYRWVLTMRDEGRRLREGKKTLLREDFVELLEKIGFDWGVGGVAGRLQKNKSNSAH